MPAYRNRPDRRRSPYAASMQVQGFISWNITAGSASEIWIRFTERVTHDGAADVFKIWNIDDLIEQPATGAELQPDGLNLLLTNPGTWVGTLTLTPNQTQNHVRSLSGRFLDNGPNTIAI